MIPTEYLKPLPKYLKTNLYKIQQIGGRIVSYYEGEAFPDLESFDLALFSVAPKDDNLAYLLREELYTLFMGNWDKKIVDLGTIIEAEREEDTQFAVKSICRELLKNKIIPILIGGNQSLSLALYQSFEEQLVNMVSVSAKFDLGDKFDIISEDSYLSKIFSSEPTHLQNFSNMGYQSYYVAQEELDLMQNMIFDVHRLGIFTADITDAEPILRNADLVGIDMTCVQAKDLDISDGYPNGFSNREICNIARYSGLSNQGKCFGVFNLPDSALGMALTAQVVWYILEGFNFRTEEYPTEEDMNYIKYTIPIDDYVIIFFKSLLTQRWWIQPYHKGEDKIITSSLIPCSEKEYKETLKGNIPEKWWKAYNSF